MRLVISNIFSKEKKIPYYKQTHIWLHHPKKPKDKTLSKLMTIKKEMKKRKKKKFMPVRSLFFS